jgi:hypothetical protein
MLKGFLLGINTIVTTDSIALYWWLTVSHY